MPLICARLLLSLLSTHLLTIAGETGLSEDSICPDDIGSEAEAFWKKYFEDKCSVDWDDVPSLIKKEILKSVSFPLESSDKGTSQSGVTCRVMTPLTHLGDLAFNIKQAAKDPTPEGWLPVDGTAIKLQMKHGQKVESSACSVFGPEVPTFVQVTSKKTDEVWNQVKEDIKSECPAFGKYDVAIHSDGDDFTIRAKQTLTEEDGNLGYRFDIPLSVPHKAEPVVIEVYVEDAGLPDDAEGLAIEEEAENARQEMAAQVSLIGQVLMQTQSTLKVKNVPDSENEDDTGRLMSAQVSASGNVLMQTQKNLKAKNVPGSEEADDDTKGELASAEKEADDRHEAILSANSLPKNRSRSSPGNSTGTGPSKNFDRTAFGHWRVLDDMFSPPLCCLCSSCTNMSLCHGGSPDTTAPSFLEEVKGPLPHKVGLAAFSSKEALAPPARPSAKPSAVTERLRRRHTESGYGDTFHTDILPKRTAEDHAMVWARSRALVQTVKEEGIPVPEQWHFFDDDERARCWQPAYSQGKCGSCWAFASLSSLEKQICMKAHGSYVPSLSREMLVRCSEQNMACEGGNADKAYEDLMEIGGVFGTDCIPYQGKGSKHCPAFSYSWFGQKNTGKGVARIDQELMKSCHDLQRYSNRPPLGTEWELPFRMVYEQRFGGAPNFNDTRVARYRKNFAKSRARDRVPSWWVYSEDAIKSALVKYGSLYVSYRARKDFKNRICKDGCWPPGTVWGEEAQFYESTCGCPSGHAVHVIGYGTDIQETGVKVPYWLIENSWGPDIHGNVIGEDINGVKGWGKDPFTEDHPMGKEGECVLAGWAQSSIPRSGGCSGSQNVAIRKDVPMDSKPDGFFLAVEVDGTMVLNQSIAADSSARFMAVFPVSPGSHNVTFIAYARNHPKQQSFPVETYSIKATSIRCRGTGFRYSFTQNDTKANLSWGRRTRAELEAAANQVLRDNGVDPSSKLKGCPTKCRTGRYSVQQPCLGLVMSWGSCYTSTWAFRQGSYYMRNKLADCRNCTATKIGEVEKAIATHKLPRSEFIKWHGLVQQAFTAPDAAGWMRPQNGSCNLVMGGFVTNAQLSATYTLYKPYGSTNDGKGTCDERFSAPYAKGAFVNAPGLMQDGETATQRCPSPLAGNVEVHCAGGVLAVRSNTCRERATLGSLSTTSRAFHRQCEPKATEAACLSTSVCTWAGTHCVRKSTGYFKILRGYNYHGIEDGAAFAIAEMDRFVGQCPTTGWTRWSACTASLPCEKGNQTRTRSPAKGYSRDHPVCRDLQLSETRSCVKPGFCPEVLMRFAASASSDVNGFMKSYKAASQTLPYATAGATMMETAYPNCSAVQYWCSMTTGSKNCAFYVEGHFQVKKAAEYFFRYEASGGGGELEFNTLGEGSELKPQYKIKSDGTMYEWQDVGFHHRRRRTDVKPWVRASSFKLPGGTYFARLTRTSWSGCADYHLRLEQMNSVYSAPLLFGGHGQGNDALGNARQFTTQWKNDWGAISQHYLRYRGRYSSYAHLKETGAANEMVFRDERGGKVIGKTAIKKLNYTADELYDLFKVNKQNPAAHAYLSKYGRMELVIRSTVVIPEAGSYKFKYQQDCSSDASNQGWRMSNRRRYQKVVIRADGKTQASRSGYLPSIELTVTYTASKAGTTTFEISSLLNYDGIDSHAALPNFFLAEVKLEDMLHGVTLPIGTKTRYMSPIEAIRGDQEVRIDWPDRDDPLSAALRTSTFQNVMPDKLLIGKQNLTGFVGKVEGKIDAGACLSLDTRVMGNYQGSFHGLSVELCDLDGANQFLGVNTYSKIPGGNVTKKKVSWVHTQFKSPTHIMITRKPSALKRFEISYRPDDRKIMGSLFPPETLLGDIGDFEGEMEVGVSMFTPEAYRYAEFYDIDVEECAGSCNDDLGNQLMCGNVTTPCEDALTCPAVCPTGYVCSNNRCMSCPALKLTPEQQKWECGTIVQVCADPQGKLVQVDRVLGVEAPSANHFCSQNHTWDCHGTSRWNYLSQGLFCGSVTDGCGKTVNLFSCPLKNDVCVGHTCKCVPATFPTDWNCGWAGDGCGLNTTFGLLNGTCPVGGVCHQHKCCTPLTTASFPGTYQCGEVPDGCGGLVTFHRTTATNFFNGPPSSITGSWYTGNVGIRVTPIQNLTLVKLARPITGGQKTLSETVKVSVWTPENVELASVMVGPSSPIQNGYAWESLSASVKLLSGKQYTFTIPVKARSADKFPWNYLYGSRLINAYHGEFGSFNGQIQTRTLPPGTSGASRGRGTGTVNFAVHANDGCGSGRWQCLANHSCFQPKIKGFTVNSGTCKVTSGGNCVTSPNYPSSYGNRQTCDITAPEVPLDVKDFWTENNYDYITINGQRFQGRRRSSRPSGVKPTEDITWRSDGSVTRRGWKLCVQGASLLAEEKEEPEAVIDEAQQDLEDQEKEAAEKTQEELAEKEAAIQLAMLQG